MQCANPSCHKELPRGSRMKIYNTPKHARFCFDCWKNWLAGLLDLNNVFVFKNGGFQFKT